jgi:purine-binding chemotaxis protein CheW
MLNEASAHEASWLLCRADAQRFVVPLRHVIETMRPLPIEAIAGAPSYVRGLCVIRGAPVPVVDAGVLLGRQPVSASRLVALRAGSRTAALLVDMVDGIRAISPSAFNRLPPLLRDAATIAAVGILDAELLLSLHTARIIPDDLPVGLDAAEATP